MSINARLLVSAIMLAFVGTTFSVALHLRNREALDATTAIFERGVDPLDRLEVASRRADELEKRFLDKSMDESATGPIGNADGAELLAGLAGVLSELRVAAISVPEGPSATKLNALAYALNRLRVAEGDVSHRLVRRELSTIVDDFGGASNALRADILAMKAQAAARNGAVDRIVWLGLAIGLLLGAFLIVLLRRSIGRSIRRAAEALLEVGGSPAESHPISAGDTMKDLLEAIRFVEAAIVQKDMAASRQRQETARRFESELHHQRQRFDAALNNMSQAFCILDEEGHLVAANAPFFGLFPDVQNGARGETLRQHADLGVILAASAAQDTSTHLMRIGRTLQVRRHEGSRDGGTIVIFDDITDQVLTHRELERLSRQDLLTGLANRTVFYERLDEALGDPVGEYDIAILALDVEGFNSVNTTLGHSAGDDLLRQFGERLRSLVGPGDLLARLDGDEFGIVQRLHGQPDAGMQLARTIQEDLQLRPVTVAGRPLSVRVAIGMVPMLDADRKQAVDAHSVMQDCEMALQQAKADPVHKLRLYVPEIRHEMQERRRLVSDLRDALDRDEFELYFQPIIDIRREAVSGFEALVRWNSPTRGLVSPGVFISLMEQNGLIVRLGRFVLQEACRHAARWPSDLSLSLNLSPLQVKSATLVPDVRQALAKSGLKPARLQLEVTESLFLDDPHIVLETLTQLRDLGAAISMDDFGTGYSSLGYLSRFPFDKIKIDQSFVRDMQRSENMAIVRAVMGLGAAMKMKVIAEGVETPEQMAVLEAEGCVEMQGFLFSKPRPASDLAKMLVQVRGGFAEGRFRPAPIVASAGKEPVRA